MMYIELFVKKYKEAILINLDVCMKQALQHLRSETWESIRTLKIDTYFSSNERTEDVKKSIKKIYQIQNIDFSQFSSKPLEMQDFKGEFFDDLLAEIARADAIALDEKTKKNQFGENPRMLCNETLDLSIMNANEGVQKGLISILESNKKKQDPLLGPSSLSPINKIEDLTISKTDGNQIVDSPRKRNIANVRSVDLNKKGSFKDLSKKNIDKLAERSSAGFVTQTESRTSLKNYKISGDFK